MPSMGFISRTVFIALLQQECRAVLLLTLVLAPSVIAQSVRRDASAVSFLSQAVSVAASGTDLSSIQDFAAQGTITPHYVGTNSVSSSVTVKSRGLIQFRIDFSQSGSTWSSIINNGRGGIIPLTGPVAPIAGHNCVNIGALTLPILKVYATLQDQTATIIDMGLAPFGSGQARQIHTQQNIQPDPTGVSSKLTGRDYFFDPSSLVLLRAQDNLHPNNDAVNGPIAHIVDFGNYQAISGLLVPFSISESISGQQTWQIQLSSIAFNTGLTDYDFQF